MITEEEMWKLDALYEAAMDEEALYVSLRDAVEAALGRIARDHFPHLGNWPAEQLRGLSDRVFRNAHQFATDMLHLDYAARQKPETPPATAL